MKYGIFYLIKGKVEKYHHGLVKEIDQKFGENCLIKKPFMSHITLKSPFKRNKIKDLEEILDSFSKKQKASEIHVNGFGNFYEYITFLNFEFSKQALETQSGLIQEIEKVGIELGKFDRKINPHATIAYGKTKENFNNIWSYLNRLEKPDFNLYFDHISIMKKPERYWKIHKTFKIEK